MPLSEHEQRLLDQIERALYAEDPKFASTVRATDLRSHLRRRVRRAAVLFVLGLVLLPLGVAFKQPGIGFVGAAIMFIAALVVAASYKRLSNPASMSGLTRGAGRRGDRRKGGGGSTRRPTRSSSGSFVQRMEERWRRRWEERGR